MPSLPRALRTAPVTRPSFCTVSPKTWMVPLPGSIDCRPVIERSRVDLPDPDGPIRATISPEAISTETPLSAFRDPKVFDTSRARTSPGATAAADELMNSLRSCGEEAPHDATGAFGQVLIAWTASFR